MAGFDPPAGPKPLRRGKARPSTSFTQRQKCNVSLQMRLEPTPQIIGRADIDIAVAQLEEINVPSARMCERAVLVNRPSLELSPLRPKGGKACAQSEGQLRWPATRSPPSVGWRRGSRPKNERNAHFIGIGSTHLLATYTYTYTSQGSFPEPASIHRPSFRVLAPACFSQKWKSLLPFLGNPR
jgi:hypothetical protein